MHTSQPSETRRRAQTSRDVPEAPRSDLHFTKRVLIVLGVVALGYFLWLTSDVLLLVFAAILAAVVLSTIASLLVEYLYVPERWALFFATILALGVIIGFGYLFGAQIWGQLGQLAERLPAAIESAGERLGIDDATKRLEDAIESQPGSSVIARITRLGYGVFGVLANVALVLVASVYFASNPDVYRRGFAMLFPPDQQDRVFEALDSTGRVLRLWLAGQLVTMVLVGTLSALAYWWIGLPSPIALGIIAGITNFIPFLGPFISAAPPLIFAIAMNMETVLWTLGAVVLIQQFEGNIATPLIQKRAVSLPPAVGVFAIVVFGVVFGIPGVFLAVPLAASLLALIRKLWVRETLHSDIAGHEDRS